MNTMVPMSPLVLACALIAAAARAASPVVDEVAPAYEAILKIDAHSHIFEDHPDFQALFQRNNVRTVNVCVIGTDGHLQRMHSVAFDLYRRYPTLYPFVSTFDLLKREEPDYTKNVIAWLGETFARGAVGVKVWKEVGLRIKRPDGSFALPDDPFLDPIYAYVARQVRVLQIHSAEPIEAWLPLDKDSPHYDYFSKSPDRRFHGRSEYPSHATIMAARDHIMEKHPTLVVLAAHLASLEHDLDGIARRLDRYPNFHVEVSSRTRDLTRHPSDRVRAFMMKYQDRLLYGVDQGWQPHLSRGVTDAQRAGAINLLELRYRIDYDYYAGSGEKTYDNRKVEALHLPRRVLEKFYHENARRLFKLDAAWQGKP